MCEFQVEKLRARTQDGGRAEVVEVAMCDDEVPERRPFFFFFPSLPLSLFFPLFLIRSS